MRRLAEIVAFTIVSSFLFAAAPALATPEAGRALVLPDTSSGPRCYVYEDAAAGVYELRVETNGVLTGGSLTPWGEESGLQRASIGSTPPDRRVARPLDWWQVCRPQPPEIEPPITVPLPEPEVPPVPNEPPVPCDTDPVDDRCKTLAGVVSAWGLVCFNAVPFSLRSACIEVYYVGLFLLCAFGYFDGDCIGILL